MGGLALSEKPDSCYSFNWKRNENYAYYYELFSVLNVEITDHRCCTEINTLELHIWTIATPVRLSGEQLSYLKTRDYLEQLGDDEKQQAQKINIEKIKR